MQKNNYLRNTIANLTGDFILAGMMFVFTPLLMRLLGDTQYGLFRVALVSVISYSSLLDMGLNSAVRRFFADAIHQHGDEHANQILGIAYHLYFIISAIAMFCILVLLWWLPGWVQTPPEIIWAFRFLLLGAGIYISAQFLVSPLRSILIVFGRYELLQISTISVRAILFALGIALLYCWKYSLASMAIAAIVASILTLLLTALLARHVFPSMSIQWDYRNRTLQKQIFSFSGYGFMIALGPLAVYQTQDILISGFLGPDQVTTFAVAAIILTQMRTIGAAIASPLFPIASKLKAQNNLQGIQDLLITGTRRCLWVWGAFAGPLIIFAGDFIGLWVGSEYRWVEVLVWILLIGNLGTIMSFCPGHILTASASIKWLGYSQLILAIAAVFGMVLELWLTSWGLVGLAWFISILLAVRSGILVPIYACLQLRLASWRFFLFTLGPLAAYLAFAIGLSYAVRHFIGPESLVDVLVCMSSLGLVVTGIGLFIMLPAKDRKRFFRWRSSLSDIK